MAVRKKSSVPRDTPNPIQHLIDSGAATILGLATEWRFKTTDAVYRLKRFEYVPPADTAVKMGETFGWTPGEVVDFWLQHVAQPEPARAAR